MRIITRYIKENAPAVEVVTDEGDYFLNYGDDTIDIFSMGDLLGFKMAQMFINRKVDFGYEPERVSGTR